MAKLHLVTGYNGTPHITSADQGLMNAGCIGTGEYVLNLGKKFEAQIIDNNTVRISDGNLLMQGRHVNLDAPYVDVIIPNGTQSMNRNDLIVVRYTKDTSTGIESADFAVIQGTPSSGTAADPTYNTASILNGVATHDMPLYRVQLSGLTIERVEPMFQVLTSLSDSQSKQNMLINGDFLCNQRGEKSYTTRSNPMYSVDMWRIFQLKLDVLVEGIRLTGNSATEQGYFTQFVQLGELKTVTYTISAMVDDEICTFTVTPGGTAKERDFGKFKITALTTSKWDNNISGYDNKLKVNICPIGTNSIVIKYIDLIEGTAALPHTKEDFATAMMRCRRYIQKNAYVSPIMYYDGSTSNDRYIYGLCINDMTSTFNNPVKIAYLTKNYYDGNGETFSFPQTGSVSAYPNDDTYTTVEVNSFTKITVSHSRYSNTVYNKHPNCYAIKGVYLATSEPRDA